LEDIPKEVEVLINDIRTRLRDIESADLLDVADSLGRSGKIADCNEGIVVLDTARKNLAKIDARMEDCMRLLLSFCEIASRPPAPPADNTSPTGAETPANEEG
jgi:hypothetical protein